MEQFFLSRHQLRGKVFGHLIQFPPSTQVDYYRLPKQSRNVANL